VAVNTLKYEGPHRTIEARRVRINPSTMIGFEEGREEGEKGKISNQLINALSCPLQCFLGACLRLY